MATVAPRLFDMSSGGAANASRAEGSGTHTEDGLDPVNIGTIKIGTDPIDYPSDANGSSRSSSEQQSPSGDEKSASPPLAVSTASITLNLPPTTTAPNLPTQTNFVPSTSDFQPSTSASVLPSPSSKRQSRQIAAYFDDQHIYANVREMEEVNSRPVPPAPSSDAVPTRDLKNGWLEFENELGRTFFYNVDTGKTQWIPPRFLRTPAEVQAMLKARGELMDFVCSTSSSAPVEQKQDDHLQANPHQTEGGQRPKMEGRKHEEEIFDEPAEEPSDQEDHLHEDDGRFDYDNESEQFDEPAEDEEEFYQQAPPLPIKKNSGEFNNSGSPLMTSFMASNSQTDNFASSLMQPSTSDRPTQGEMNRRENHRHSSPQANAASRSLSFNNRSKHVAVPQVQPTTSGNGTCFGSVPTPTYNHEYAVPPPCPTSDCKPIPSSMVHSYSHTLDRPPFHRGDQQRSVDSKSSIENERRCSSESREPVRTIRSGNMERCEWNETNKGRKREWIHGFVYLTSAHFILYKDERSAEKHGKHYDAPLCVWDLKGATISWNVEKDKKKRKVIQLELCNACRYLLRTSNDNETQEWFEALRDVIARLPPPTHQEIQSAILDSNSCSVMRNPSLVSHTPRPVSAASSVIVNKTRLRGRSDVMAQSAIETSTCEESRPNRETILEKLRRFFRTRPSMETLKEKGIYKPEPVFGSTLSTICQHEKSLVPKFIRVVIEVIESKGLDTDGLYRVSGNLSAVQKIRCHVDQDNYKALVNEEDVHVLTGAFKLFFRELSEPLFPPSMHKDYISAMQNPIASSRFKKFDELLARLPSENRETLKSVLKHLTSVAAHSQQNRMQLHNLSIMFGPTLFQSGERDEKKKGGKETSKKKKVQKEEKPTPVQSNSHLAFSMIMQSQIVQYLLETYQKFDALKGPIQYIP